MQQQPAPHLAVKVGEPPSKLVAGLVTQRHSILQSSSSSDSQYDTAVMIHSTEASGHSRWQRPSQPVLRLLSTGALASTAKS
jgi:hypothetical protein